MNNYTRLTINERCKLATFLDMNLKVSEIARRLGRHRSTIYREMSRNRAGLAYRPVLANKKARARHPRKRCKLQTDRQLYHYVYDRLRRGWSPEQIAGYLRRSFKSNSICHETIYRYIYMRPDKKLYKYLTKKKRKRRRFSSRKRLRCRYGDIRLITKRPAYIDNRSCFGHWEGDLIEFRGTRKQTITTLVERKTRMLILIKNTSKVSYEVMSSIRNKFLTNDRFICHSITFDQGVEFAQFGLLESRLGCKAYYCERHSPWQKGSNENMNGRIRKYLPKRTDISKIDQEDLDYLAHKMNTTPRKCLGFKTPLEVFLSVK